MGNNESNDDDIIYRGVVPSKPAEHDTVFGSNPEKGQHFTVAEGETREED